MVYDKSDAHKTIYDSYNLELASTLMKNVELENALNNNRLSNEIDFDFENDFDKQQLYKQFLAYNCKGCSLREIPLQKRFRTFLKENSVEVRTVVLKRN